ncbi:sigma-70 family RNA polymerase sigma factor [Halobacillus sp. A5]|uniref:sigma-70 family RNA polymerase sigma factor n=1 Tax=Halobacillus sp. A5 TaxID=2880263 RepID=UPI0020A6D1DB|nr:sigma-70 family RNA polymerase sigma factor [Halobacillus sp. A5]MCP3026623.1 sigma-70 family RNA polymerase sigma factor [Halobacillus sp. A5]
MNEKQIENLIYEYHWKSKEVSRLENILFGSSIPMRGLGAIEYSIEATLPKGSPLKSKKELEEMDMREERLYRRWEDYRQHVYAVELIADTLENDQLLIIIDCMMDGMSYRSIADHLRMSRSKVGEMKNEMLYQICQLCQEGQKCQFVSDLLLEKSTV